MNRVTNLTLAPISLLVALLAVGCEKKPTTPPDDAADTAGDAAAGDDAAGDDASAGGDAGADETKPEGEGGGW